MSNFPSDLIVDILLYLPVKSLCRFKCVSKSLSALITHPQFVKLHQARTQRQKFLLAIGASLYHVDLETSLLQQEPSSSSPSYRKVVPIKHDRPFKEEYDYRSFGYKYSWVVVSESSNGLFCTTKFDPPNHDFFVYNPSTRESKKIPKIESEKESDNCSLFTLHGFGYAESIDDYKFVKVLIERKIILIFSRRQNSWKTIKCDFPFIVNSSYITSLPFAGGANNYGIPLNGAIHWVVPAVDFDYYRDPRLRIVAFDLVEEKFKTLPLPDQAFQKKFRWFRLLRDCLCLIDQEYKFWIMEEYGTKESWTRILVPNKPYSGKCLWEDSGFLFMNLGDDGWLQRNNDRFTFFDRIRCYKTYAYVENLVSLNFHTNGIITSEGINNFTRL